MIRPGVYRDIDGAFWRVIGSSGGKVIMRGQHGGDLTSVPIDEFKESFSYVTSA